MHGVTMKILLIQINDDKRKSSPVKSLEWPRGFQEVKAPRFQYNGIG